MADLASLIEWGRSLDEEPERRSLDDLITQGRSWDQEPEKPKPGFLRGFMEAAAGMGTHPFLKEVSKGLQRESRGNRPVKTLQEAILRDAAGSDPVTVAEQQASYLRARIPFSPSSTMLLVEFTKAAKRYEGGDRSDGTLRLMAEAINKASRESHQSWAKSVLDLVTTLPKTGIEFMATGGAYAGVKKGIQEGIKKKIGTSLAARVTAGVAGRAGGVIAQTAAMPHLATESIVRRAAPDMNLSTDEAGDLSVILDHNDEGFAETVGLGTLDSLIEVASERSGGLLDKVPYVKGLKAAVVKRLLGEGKTVKTIQSTLKKAGWNGVFAEMGEERVGEVARGLTGVSEDYGVTGALLADPFDSEAWRQLSIEAAAFSVVPAGSMALSRAVKLEKMDAKDGFPTRSEWAEIEGRDRSKAPPAHERGKWLKQRLEEIRDSLADPNADVPQEPESELPEPGAVGVGVPEAAESQLGPEGEDVLPPADGAQPEGFEGVVYHGTTEEFTEWKPGGLGIHFGTSDQANSRISRNLEDTPDYDQAGARIIPARVSLQNPLRLPDGGHWELPSSLKSLLVKEGILTGEESLAIEKTGDLDTDMAAIRQALVEKGYDGIVYLNRHEASGVSSSDRLAMTGKSDEEFQAKFPGAEESFIVFDPAKLSQPSQPSEAPGPDNMIGREGVRKAAAVQNRAGPKRFPRREFIEKHMGAIVGREDAEAYMVNVGVDENVAKAESATMAEATRGKIKIGGLVVRARQLLETDDRRGRREAAVKEAGDAKVIEFQKKDGSGAKFIVHPATQVGAEDKWQITRITENGPEGHYHHNTREEAIAAAVGAHPDSTQDDGDADYQITKRTGKIAPPKGVATGQPSEAAKEPSPEEAAEAEVMPQTQEELLGEPPATQSPVGIANQIVNEARERRDLVPFNAPSPESQRQWLDEAAARMESEPNWIEGLITEITAKPRNLEDREAAGVAIHMRTLANRIESNEQKINDAYDQGEEDASAPAQIKSLNEELDKAEKAANAAGTKWGRAGVARKILLWKDFSHSSILRSLRAADDGKPNSAEDITKYTQLAEQIAAKDAEIAEMKKEKRERTAKEAYDAVVDAEPEEFTLDGRPAKEWMTSALHARADKLGVPTRSKNRERLIHTINGVEANIKSFAEEWNLSVPSVKLAIQETSGVLEAELARMREIKKGVLEATGLLPWDVPRLVNNGFDYSSTAEEIGGVTGVKVSGLDEAATALASEYPDYFGQDENPTAKLWELLEQQLPESYQHDSPMVLEKAGMWILDHPGSENLSEEQAGLLEREKPKTEQWLNKGERTEKKSEKSKRQEEADKGVKDALKNFWDASVALAQGQSTMMSGIPVDLIQAAAGVVKAYAYRNYVSFSEFWADIKSQVKDAPGKVGTRENFHKAWKQVYGATDLDPTSRKQSQERASKVDPTNPESIMRFARSLQRDVMEAGERDPDAVLAAVHDDLQEVIPGISEFDTMAAIAGVDTYRLRSKDELDVAIGDLRGQYQQRTKLGQMAKGKAPSLFGGQMREPSDIERELIQRVNEEKKKGGYDTTDPERQAATTLGAMKTAIRNRLTDRRKEIADRVQNVPDHRQTETDAEYRKLRAELDKVNEEYAEVFPPEPPTSAEQIKRGIEATQREISKINERIKKGRIFGKVKGRPATSVEWDVLKADLAVLRDTLEELRKIGDPQWSNRAYYRSLLTEIAKNTRRIAEKDFSEKVKPDKVYDKRILDKQYEAEQLRTEVAQGVAQKRKQSLKGWAKARSNVVDVANTNKILQSMGEWSFVLRQAGPAVSGNPINAATMLPNLFKATFSGRSAFGQQESLKKRDNFHRYRIGKTAITEIGATLNTEEDVIGGLLDNIPGLSHMKDASERAAVTFLNTMRADRFDALYEDHRNRVGRELTHKELRQIGNQVNVSTGFGNLGPMEKSMNWLPLFLWSPRFVMARFQQLTLQPLWGTDRAMQKTLGKEIARQFAGRMAFVALTQILWGFLYADDDEDKPTMEFDLRSADFLKMRFGPTRVDMMGGTAQILTYLARTVSRSTKTGAGKVVPTVGDKVPYGGSTWGGIHGRFLQSKLAPWVGTTAEFITKEDFHGQPTTRAGTLGRAVVMMTYKDIYEGFQSNGIPQATAMALVAMFGAGLQSYESKREKGQREYKESLQAEKIGR